MTDYDAQHEALVAVAETLRGGAADLAVGDHVPTTPDAGRSTDAVTTMMRTLCHDVDQVVVGLTRHAHAVSESWATYAIADEGAARTLADPVSPLLPGSGQ